MSSLSLPPPSPSPPSSSSPFSPVSSLSLSPPPPPHLILHLLLNLHLLPHFSPPNSPNSPISTSSRISHLPHSPTPTEDALMPSTEAARRLSPITESRAPLHMPLTPSARRANTHSAPFLLPPTASTHAPSRTPSSSCPSTSASSPSTTPITTPRDSPPPTKIPSPSPRTFSKPSPRLTSHIHPLHSHRTHSQSHSPNAHPKFIPARPAPPPPPPRTPSPSYACMSQDSPPTPQRTPSQARGRRPAPTPIITAIAPEKHGLDKTTNLAIAQYPRTTTLPPFSSSRTLRSPSPPRKGSDVSAPQRVENTQSSSDESTPTMTPVGALVTEHSTATTTTTTLCKVSAERSLQRRPRPLSAMALHRTTPGLKNNSRSLSPGRAYHTKQRPASALGHPSLAPFGGAVPLSRGNSLVVPASLDDAPRNTITPDDAPPSRRSRVQSDGSRQLSPPQSPTSRGLSVRQALTPMSDDYSLDGMDEARSSTPLRRQSIRIASFISRFGQDAARRLTKSPTPSPLCIVASPDTMSLPSPTIKTAKRQSGSFGVIDDGSDTESIHRFYHDNTRRRRNSCGSIVEVTVRRLYAENADTHSHAEEEIELPLSSKAETKSSGALDLLCLVPDATVRPSNSASDLSTAGLDSSPSSPPGLSRSSSQWTPPSDSVCTLPSTSPCSTLPPPAASPEALLFAASQMLNSHGVTLLHHAEQLSEASSSLRALATESLEWGSRLMAAANRSMETFHSPPMVATPSPSQTPTPRASIDGLPDGMPAISSPSPRPARRSEEHRLSQRSPKRKSWILKPVRHASLLMESERLASLGWSRLQTSERSAHSVEAADTSRAFADDYVMISGSRASASPEPIVQTSPTSMSDPHRGAHDSEPSSPGRQSDQSSNSHDSEDLPEEVPSLLPPINLIPPIPRADQVSTKSAQGPVSKTPWSDSSTKILVSSPDPIDKPEPDYSVASSTPTLTPSRSSTDCRNTERHSATPSLQTDQTDNSRLALTPVTIMVDQPPEVPDIAIYTNPQFAQTAVASPTTYPAPLPQKLPRKSDTDLPSRLKRRLSGRYAELDRSGATTPRRWFRWARQTD
ncbi:hypothetical protein CC85DRAFT_331578 [Cutaneotrichosporon oleaginosum]|uniref:Uncharacterized protein n=1 Tax=Cutaneotrichosporon oleaginosum TaxID=879819 RepID=A0A0J0XBQ0_9TREE|nr:uncharacterized protein CC85DRAFT_331578 [Cutaneotrichosporon oleaginosum]KLT38486.1 hypothetical protein CC85DRAFT_331578 [Cutaneotrichosporon oleaginosum]TXT12166.1 hypothetical protein COLE_02576 [Cutaneotrichosporon oleaginosum]